MPQFDPRTAKNIEKLEKEIYSHDFKSDVSSRSSLSPDKVDVTKDWQHDGSLEGFSAADYERPKMSLFKKIFILSVLFFLGCAAVAIYMLYRGIDIISADKVDITFVGPVSVAAGNQIDVSVIVTNKNNIPLQNVALYVDYPDGTKESQDITQDLLHAKYDLGTIAVGSNAEQPLSMVLFGPEHTKKDIDVKLEYSVKNSNAPFNKSKTYEVELTSAPVSIHIDNPPQISSTQDLPFTVTVSSNSSAPINNVFVQAEYPFGFQFVSATPTPTSNSNTWAIPKLMPGDTKKISLVGRIDGQDGDVRVLKFSVGSGSATSTSIETNFLTADDSLTLQKPPLAIAMDINGSNAQVLTVGPGSSSGGTIHITNNLTTQVLNTRVQLIFAGTALDPLSPRSDAGLYRAPTLTLSWDKSTNNSLSLLKPGDSVDLDFTFSALTPEQLRGIKNGGIQLLARVDGVAANTDQGNHILSSMISRKIQIQPTFGVVSRDVYSVGPFKNTGPIPPKTETPTTYTVIWTVTSSTDDMTGIVVRAKLPSYVKWLNKKTPTSENLTWNSNNNEVVWQVGDIPAGIQGQPAREVSFQIELDPSTSQKGSIPTLVDSQSYSGTDGFTNNQVGGTMSPLTTNISTDPKAQDNSAIVQ